MTAEAKDEFYISVRRKISNFLSTKEGEEYEWSKYLLLAPDLLHLLTKLMWDKDVATADKAKIGLAVTYFVSPLDIIPELILGPVAFLEDVAIAVHVVNGILKNTDEEVVLKHWAGDADLLESIEEILDKADFMLGPGKWKKIKNWVFGSDEDEKRELHP